MVLVVISAIIVATYIGLQLVIRAPEIPQTEPDTPPSSSSQIGQPSAPPEDPNALVRKEGVYTFALLGKDVKGSNTDTIILARYDTVAQTVGMVSIPRDTAVHRTWSKYSKINAAFYGSSPETLKEEIQNTFGIPVDYYILVDPKGFTALVDELGGVDVYIPENMNYDDPTPGEELHIHYQAGTHHLNGKQALEVARFRHNNDGSGYTDTGRAEMHRQMLVALPKRWSPGTRSPRSLPLWSSSKPTSRPTCPPRICSFSPLRPWGWISPPASPRGNSPAGATAW